MPGVVVRAALALPLGVRTSYGGLRGERHSTVTPIERAVPAMIFIGGVDVVGVEVGHLGLGDLADLRGGDLADLDLVRVAEPFSTPAAFLISSAAGGVFVMKVNERSS
jgi:hypothetical protein